MPGEEILGPLMELIYGAQVSPPEVYKRVEQLPPDERRDFIDGRTQSILSGSARMAQYELGPIGGMSIEDSEGRGKGLLVVHLLDVAVALLSIVGARKSDVSPAELKPRVGNLDPKDQQAVSQVGRTIEWLPTPGATPIKTRFNLTDFLFEFADVRNMEYLEEQMEIGDGGRFLKGHEQRMGMSKGWMNVFSRVLQRKYGNRPVFPSNDAHIPPIEWMSLTLPLEDPRGGMVLGVERLANRDMTIQRLADALDPYVTTAEALLAYWGYIGAVRQNVETFMLFPGLRDLMAGGPYNELYATGNHHCLSNFSVEAYPSHFLKVLPKGIMPRMRELLPDLNKEQIRTLEACLEAPYPIDPMAVNSIVSGGNTGEIKRLLSNLSGKQKVTKLVEDPASGRLKEKALAIGRPVGTQGAVARELVLSNPDLFAGIDFTQVPNPDTSVTGGTGVVNVLEKAGITGEFLREIIASGKHLGNDGFVMLMEHGLSALFEYPFYPRAWRNWPHYFGSFEPTLLAVGKNGPEQANEISLSPDVLTIIQRNLLGEPTSTALRFVKFDVEQFAASRVEDIAKALVGDEKAWRFGEAPELSMYLERSLINIIAGHFVYPTNRKVDNDALERMREKFPSAGLIVNADWENFLERKGLQVRPERLTNKHISDNQLIDALRASGCYQMAHGSEKSGTGTVATKEWISPLGEIIYKMVDNVTFFRSWLDSAHRVAEVDSSYNKRDQAVQALEQSGWFSVVHMYGDLALPASLWLKVLDILEGPRGIPFLRSGYLGNVREFIQLAIEAELLRPDFSFLHPRLLSLGQQLKGEKEMLNRMRKLRFADDALVPKHIASGASTSPW